MSDTDAGTETELRLIDIADAFELAQLVYHPFGLLKSSLAEWGYKPIEAISCFRTGTQITLAQKDRAVVIAFRGSESALDWLVDALCLPWGRPRRHLGFYLAWRSVHALVKEHLDVHRSEYDMVKLCGHSLGGAIANIAALELAGDYPIRSVVTFGAPRVFFRGAAVLYDEFPVMGIAKDPLGKCTTQVVNGRDVVATLPPRWLGFREIGQLIYIDRNGVMRFNHDAIAARERDRNADLAVLLEDYDPSRTLELSHNATARDYVAYVRRWVLTHIVPLRYLLMPVILYVRYLMVLVLIVFSAISHRLDLYGKPIFTRIHRDPRIQPSVPLWVRVTNVVTLLPIVAVLLVGVGIIIWITWIFGVWTFHAVRSMRWI
jgi:pimeloyl-ACP methyl ester carboxylesterase